MPIFSLLLVNLLYAQPTNASFPASPHGPHVIFNERGSVIIAHDVLHLSLDIDTSYYSIDCSNFRKLYSDIEKRLHDKIPNTKNQPFRKHKAILLNTHNKIDEACVLPDLFAGLNQEHLRRQGRSTRSDDQHHIDKRQIASAVGLLAGALFGLYTQHQIRQLAADVQNVHSAAKSNLLIIGKMETRLSVYQEDMVTVLHNIAYLDRDIKELWYGQDFVEQMLAFNLALDTFATHTKSLSSGVNALLQGHLSLDLLHTDKVSALWDRVMDNAGGANDQIFRSPFDLFQLPASFILDQGGVLRVFVHMPITHKTLQLFKYAPFPVSVNSDTSEKSVQITFNHPQGKDMIAISSDQSIHVELALADLGERCYRFNSNWICDTVSVLNRDTKTSCLGGLYTGNQETIRAQCETHRFAAGWQLEKIQPEKYLIFSQEPMPLHLSCTNGSRTALVVHGYDLLRVEPSCSAMSDAFVLQTTTMSDMKLTWSYPAHFDLTGILEGHSVENLVNISNELTNLNLRPDDDLDDLLTQAKVNLNVPLQSSGHGFSDLLVTVLAVLGALTLIALLGLGCITVRQFGARNTLSRFSREIRQLRDTVKNSTRPEPPSMSMQHLHHDFNNRGYREEIDSSAVSVVTTSGTPNSDGSEPVYVNRRGRV